MTEPEAGPGGSYAIIRMLAARFRRYVAGNRDHHEEHSRRERQKYLRRNPGAVAGGVASVLPTHSGLVAGGGAAGRARLVFGSGTSDAV